MFNNIRVLLVFIFAMSMMYLLLDCKIKSKKNVYLLGLIASVVIIFDTFVLIRYGYVRFMELYPILVQLPGFLAFVFLSRFNFIKVFFVHLTLVAITSSISMIGIIVSYFFDFNVAIGNITCYILYLPIWFLIYRYVRPSVLYMLLNTDKGWFGFCAIPLAYTVNIYLVSNYNLEKVDFQPQTIIFIAMILVLTLAAYFMILRFFKQTRQKLALQNEQNLLSMQIAAAKMHLGELKDSQEKTIIYRHDMRHHLALIGAYIADNNNAAAKEYISEVEKAIDSVVVEKYCSNYSVNLILSSYIAKAREVGIDVETQIDLPERTNVSDMDLCVIFSNAIENAINACGRISSTNSRYIKIACKTKNDKLHIQISNRYEGTILFVDEMPISTEENHGLGTRSIAAVAQAYGGVFSFAAEDGIFKTSVIL